MTTQPDLEHRIDAFGRGLNDEQMEDAFVMLAERRGRGAPGALARLAETWPAEPSDLLDAAARLAARHEALTGGPARVRSLLELLVRQHAIAQQLGGERRNVVDAAEQSLLLQAQVEGEALRTIWDEPMLAAGAAALALGARSENRERVRQYRAKSWLLGIPSGRGYLYPEFQFDTAHRDVATEVREVNARLDAANDPWGVASWWVSRNDRIGARPRDLVGTARAKDLLAIAHAMTEPIG